MSAGGVETEGRFVGQQHHFHVRVRDEKYCSTDKDTFSCLFDVRHDASAYTAHINFTSFAPLLSEFLHLSFFYSNNILLMLMSSLLGAKA